jgi:hypothetical protein
MEVPCQFVKQLPQGVKVFTPMAVANSALLYPCKSVVCTEIAANVTAYTHAGRCLQTSVESEDMCIQWQMHRCQTPRNANFNNIDSSKNQRVEVGGASGTEVVY